MARATVYTSDPTLSDFTSGITFGTFIAAPFGDSGTAVPYTPTVADVNAGLRVYGDDLTQPLIVEFSSPHSTIRVFPNIDHYGASYDGFQYSILGSNNNITYTPLYDTLTVLGTSEPFTIGTFSGTAPTSVNNVLTPGAGPSGTVGYIANFTFSQSYKYYEFGASTVGVNSGNADQELTAVGATPEPSSLLLMSSAIPGLLGVAWNRKRRMNL